MTADLIINSLNSLTNNELDKVLNAAISLQMQREADDAENKWIDEFNMSREERAMEEYDRHFSC